MLMFKSKGIPTNPDKTLKKRQTKIIIGLDIKFLSWIGFSLFLTIKRNLLHSAFQYLSDCLSTLFTGLI